MKYDNLLFVYEYVFAFTTLSYLCMYFINVRFSHICFFFNLDPMSSSLKDELVDFVIRSSSHKRELLAVFCIRIFVLE